MKRFLSPMMVGAVVLLLAACAPTATYEGENINRFYKMTVNGEAIAKTDNLFVIEWDDVVFTFDLGDTQARGDLTTPEGYEVALQSILVEVNNYSDRVVQLVWDETVIVPPTGNASRVYHGGIRFAERANSQPNTVMPPASRINDIILPSDFTSVKDGYYVADPMVKLSEIPDSQIRLFFTYLQGDEKKELDIVFSGSAV